MAHPNYHTLLDATAAQAQREHNTNATAITAHCDSVKRIQAEYAARICEELGTTSAIFLQLLDEFVMPLDLATVPGMEENDMNMVSMQVCGQYIHASNTTYSFYSKC